MGQVAFYNKTFSVLTCVWVCVCVCARARARARVCFDRFGVLCFWWAMCSNLQREKSSCVCARVFPYTTEATNSVPGVHKE